MILPVLLFLIGIVFIILGWRWQNPPSNEILTAIKGMAHLKSEINRLEVDLNDLDKKVDSQAPGLTAESPEWRRIETKLLEISKPRELDLLPTAQDPRLSAYSKNNTVVAERDGQASNSINSENLNNEDNRNTLPEKYRQVLELIQDDFTVPEISKRLGISQDAVMIVVRTYQRGGKT